MGGVLVDYTADNATWHFTDDPEIVREIHNVLFCSQEWMALDMGSITDEEAIRRILPRLSNDNVREVARVTFDHWHEYNNVARPGVAAIVKSIKKRGQKAYILSNVSKRLTDTYKNVVPQPIIYQMFFQRFSLNPSECLFIDDVKANVDAAIRCGMDAWWFRTGNTDDMKKFLEV